MDNQEKSFKVKDKRIFNSEGEANPQSEEVSSETDKQEKVSAEQPKDVLSEAEQDSGEVSINFPSFLASLGTQALMLLGQIPAPEGMEVPADPKAAKQTIDILEMLKEKTAGNLDKEEAEFFEEMLHNLRIAYLQHKK